jgi:hypothetical protein
VHFEQGRDYRRAVQYLHLAGENATRRSAHREAITLLTKGLELLKTFPDTPERTQQEFRLLVTLGGPLQATRSFAAPEVGATYARARGCASRSGDPQLFPVLNGLRTFHQVRGSFSWRAAGSALGPGQRGRAGPASWELWGLGGTFFHLGVLHSPGASGACPCMTLSTTPICSSTAVWSQALWPLLRRLGPMAAGLSGPSAPEERGRADLGPRTVSSLQLGCRPGFCCPVAPAPSGKTTDPRVGRGRPHHRARARISSVGRGRDKPAGLGAGRTGPG